MSLYNSAELIYKRLFIKNTHHDPLYNRFYCLETDLSKKAVVCITWYW